VPGRESAATLGESRSRLLRQRLAEELRTSRLAAGLSIREVARRVRVSPSRIERVEEAHQTALTLDIVSRIAPVIGLQLAASLHPNGDPVRDRAHVALLHRFRRRLHPNLTWQAEVPMPIAGDLRAGDALIGGAFGTILVEAETRLVDLQAVERRSALKKRDLGAERLVLLIADTPNNRRVLELHPELRERLPVSTRKCLAALGRGDDPREDALVIL